MRPLSLPQLLTSLVLLLATGCTSLFGERPVNPADYAYPVRVACVGDSITFGLGIDDREWLSYPGQLQTMLGDDWEVRNFGHSGATLLKQGNLPYWEQQAFRDALAFDPDVVIIMLGTNDTKPINWRNGDRFVDDCVSLIESFRALPSSPRIWLARPVPSFPGNWDIADAVLKYEVIPAIDAAAKRTGVPVIDLYAALADHGDKFFDRVHPDARGSRLIAEKVYETLTGRPARTAPATVD